MRKLLLVALVSACTPTSYTFSPTVTRFTARPAGCEFTILATAPDESFEEIGTMQHYNGDVPMQEAAFRTAIAARVCDVGGNAVIAQRTSEGYKTATIIKLSNSRNSH